MSEPVETIPAESARVSCDGGGALGHPRVYLQIKPEVGENRVSLLQSALRAEA